MSAPHVAGVAALTRQAHPKWKAEQIKAAIVAWGDARGVGRDTVASAVAAQAFTVPGVLDVPTVYIGTAPSPGTSTTIAISVRQRAVYDTSRITVTLSNGTP